LTLDHGDGRRQANGEGSMRSPGDEVVVTGMGLVTPLGHDTNTVWSRVIEGKTAVRPLPHDAAGRGGAVVEDFDPAAEVTPRILKMINRTTTFALAAARRAWADAGLEGAGVDRSRIGTFVGSAE
jgi:3-oxoacyl-(acyl-carrier-protein) synthase